MLPLNNYLPYLLNRIGPPLEEGFAGPLAEAGITLQMWRVLAVLHENGDLPMGELSRLTSINLSTLSRLVGRMARKDLVSRQRDGGDQRSITVHMLQAGKRAVELLIPHARAYERHLTRDFSEAELATLKQLLSKFYDGMNATEDGTPNSKDRLAG